MKTDIPKEFKKFVKHCHCLKRILKDTKNFLDEFNNNLHIDGEHKIEFTIQDDLSQIEHKLERTPTLIIFGQNCHAKALFVNSFLDQNILPLFSANWRFITFMYGNAKNIRLTLGQEIEILEKLKAHETSWNTIPEEDIQESDQECPLDQWPSLEVELPHPVLRDNIVAMVPPDVSHPDQLPIILKNHMENVLPVIIYAVCDDVLTENNIQEIKKLKDLYQTPFLFVSVTNSEKAGVLGTESLTESEQHLVETGGQDSIVKLENLRDQLRRLGYLHGSDKTADGIMRRKSFCLEFSMDNAMCDTKINEELILFIREILKSSVLKMAASLSEVHNRYLRGFILSAFDMAREIQITPKRIKYSQEIEAKLYESLMKIASDQQDHISRIIERTLQDMKSNVAEVLEGHTSLDTQSPKMATMEIQQLVLQRLSNSVATQIVQSVGCLQESFTGTLQRCLESLEKNSHDGHEGNLSASDAVKQIVTAAYNIDLKSFSTFSVIHNLMDRLRKLLTSTWTSSHPVQCDFQWQLQVVSKIINSLSEEKLTKAISSQFQESVRSSHESFQAAIRSLESQLSGKLEHTEDQRITIRKKHAPRFARLALESTSLCDQIRWGMPKPIKEIGRGQYGVVSSCEEWGGIKPCAFKSVVPPDDRHWSDLAMEFYYTRTLPEDCRIVKLRGSIIDYTYGGGTTAVLLIMERMTRDLYCGLKNGLSWTSRVRIAIDVVEGIRYLHSQGLVHRDIKLKNVLLDNHDRAKLTDFGFCIPEAMMSGSVVGTPVHMAPELLSGRYDSSVDVYAFGILFWYICAGQTSLPNEFNKFHNKEQLWNNVRKGTRPECLKHFNPKCWNLMEQCWDAEPANRPLLGYVQPQLELIYKQAKQESSSRSFAGNDTKYSSDIDFSYNLMSVREY